MGAVVDNSNVASVTCHTLCDVTLSWPSRTLTKLSVLDAQRSALRSPFCPPMNSRSQTREFKGHPSSKTMTKNSKSRTGSTLWSTFRLKLLFHSSSSRARNSVTRPIENQRNEDFSANVRQEHFSALQPTYHFHIRSFRRHLTHTHI